MPNPLRVVRKTTTDLSPWQKWASWLHLYLSNCQNHGTIELQSCGAEQVGGTFELRDHDAIVWVRPAELGTYNVAPADLPAVEAVLYRREGSGAYTAPG